MNIRRRSPWWRRIVRRLSRVLFRWAENNDDARITRNGERWLLRELLRAHVARASGRSFVVFDVGANVGDYTRVVLEEARLAGAVVEIHAFEPSPAAAAKVRELVRLAPSVRLTEVALSDRAGQAPLHGGETGSSHASLFERRLPSDLGGGVLNVPVQRLHEYLASQSVAHLDLLQLDTEGSELAVLRGLGGQLRPEVVDAIQFEYGGTTRDAGVALRDLHDLLVERGFVFAKLFPHSLERRIYSEWMDNFSFANYVAMAPRWLKGPSSGEPKA